MNSIISLNGTWYLDYLSDQPYTHTVEPRIPNRTDTAVPFRRASHQTAPESAAEQLAALCAAAPICETANSNQAKNRNDITA